MSEYVLKETCWCGASLELENWGLPSITQRLAEEWRKDHKCRSDHE